MPGRAEVEEMCDRVEWVELLDIFEGKSKGSVG